MDGVAVLGLEVCKILDRSYQQFRAAGLAHGATIVARHCGQVRCIVDVTWDDFPIDVSDLLPQFTREIEELIFKSLRWASVADRRQNQELFFTCVALYFSLHQLWAELTVRANAEVTRLIAANTKSPFTRS